MQRYFAPVEDGKVLLDDNQQHHLLKVMRAKVGETFEVVSDGATYLAKIEYLNPFKTLLIKKLNDNHELDYDIILFYCLAKGDKNELVIQKATELGISKIVLVESKRTVVKIKMEDRTRKLFRFQKIATEAAEQSKRNFVPTVEICSLKEIPSYDVKHRFIAYENEKQCGFISNLKNISKGDSISLVVGAEGGFDEDEVTYLQKARYCSVSLGRRILRSETAAITMMSALMLYLEEEGQ